MITYFFLGLLNVNSILLLWFFSPLKNTLGKILFKKDLMPVQFDDYVFVKNKVIGELISCWICCSFWLSLLTGVVYMFFLQLPFFWPVVTFLSYPGLSYIFYTFIKR